MRIRQYLSSLKRLILRTERDRVDFAFDLNDGRLDVENVDDLIYFCLVNHDRLIVLVVFLTARVRGQTRPIQSYKH